jgi:hypothetical protein
MYLWIIVSIMWFYRKINRVFSWYVPWQDTDDTDTARKTCIYGHSGQKQYCILNNRSRLPKGWSSGLLLGVGGTTLHHKKLMCYEMLRTWTDCSLGPKQQVKAHLPNGVFEVSRKFPFVCKKEVAGGRNIFILRKFIICMLRTIMLGKLSQGGRDWRYI